MTVVAGIDEAGYGPMLGPLVVAASAFRLEDGVKESALHRLIALADGTAGLPIDDSKKLYRGPDGLGRLECSVLGHALLARGALPPSIGALLAGAVDFDCQELDELPWYGSQLLHRTLPRRAAVEEVLARTACQAELLAARGLACVGLHVAPVPEPRFNTLTEARGTKAWPLFIATGRLIDTLMTCHPQEELVIHVDRHGGRAHYLELLAGFFPLAPIRMLAERHGDSSYSMDFTDRPPVRVNFRIEADGRYAPVALASLVAKTVRELFMERFNEWFAEQLPGLRPTAGYHGDAQRFLRDVVTVLHVSAPRQLLVRVR
jgi:ribonuclease HII